MILNTARFLIAAALAVGAAVPVAAAQTVATRSPQPSTVTPVNTHYGWADVLRVDPVYELVAVGPGCASARVAKPAAVAAARVAPDAGALGAGEQPAASDPNSAPPVAMITTGQDVAELGVAPAACNLDDARQQRRVRTYDVEYRYRGEIYRSQVAYDPGERLRVRVSVSPAG